MSAIGFSAVGGCVSAEELGNFSDEVLCSETTFECSIMEEEDSEYTMIDEMDESYSDSAMNDDITSLEAEMLISESDFLLSIEEVELYSAEPKLAEQSYYYNEKDYYGNQLTGTARMMYEQLVTELPKLNESNYQILFTFNTPVLITTEKKANAHGVITYEETIQDKIMPEVQSAGDALLMDHPELYWLDSVVAEITSDYSLEEKDGQVLITIPSIYLTCSWVSDEIRLPEKRSAFQQLVDAFLQKTSQKLNGTETTRQKVRVIHDLILDQAIYQENQLESSAAGFFLGGGQVTCAGYAGSFKLICDRMGIPCICVCGEAFTEKGLEGHMWNYVCENGEWYLVDCTWDDSYAAENPLTYFWASGRRTGALGIPIENERTAFSQISGGMLKVFTFALPKLTENEVHEWKTDSSRAVSATCLEPGKEVLCCDICGAVQENATEKSSVHTGSPILLYERSADESGAGYSGDLVCSLCGEMIQEGYQIEISGSAEPVISTKVSSKTYKASALKKKKKSFMIGASAKTDLTYRSSSKKYVKVSPTGKVTLKKGTPKGIYKITITAAPDDSGRTAVKVIRIKVK